MKLCLDTNTIIYYLKGLYPAIAERLKEVSPSDIAIPEIVCAELQYGVLKSQQQKQNRARLTAFLAPYEKLPFSGDAVEHYADIRAKLERNGTPIGPNDLIIAATVRAHGATLITRNVDEFSRVDGLSVAGWTLPV